MHERPQKKQSAQKWSYFSPFTVTKKNKKAALVQVSDVSHVEVVPGRLVHLIADEVDQAIPQGLGKGRLYAASHLVRTFSLKLPHRR